jgi:hypothetical protein
VNLPIARYLPFNVRDLVTFARVERLREDLSDCDGDDGGAILRAAAAKDINHDLPVLPSCAG